MAVEIDEHTASELAAMFRMLGDPMRIRILSLLLQGEANVSSIAEDLSASPSSISHHLRNLRQMGLVTVRREGRYMYYSLNGDPLAEIMKHALMWMREE
jgi:ArsR family transcriptional regulator